MKTFIHFSLLAILILAGCKGNKSFLAQRYTKNGHSHSPHAKAAVAERKHTAATVKHAVTPVPVAEFPANTELMAVANPATAESSHFVKTKAAATKSTKQAVSDDDRSFRSLVEKSSGRPTIKSVGQGRVAKIAAAKGVISTTLEIVLAIIVLAIIVVVGVVVLAVA